MTDAVPSSCLYLAKVRHERTSAPRHGFSYRMACLLLDIDRLPELAAGSRLFRHNRRGAISLRDCDYGPRDGSPLRPWVERRLAEAGISEAPRRILLLTQPRVLGYSFNPISLFYCFAANGRLQAVIYEVHNTFGGQHCYVMPVESEPGTAIPGHATAKRFYVSPFLPIEGRYRFRLTWPGERLLVGILTSTRDEHDRTTTLAATLTARRRPWTDATLGRAFLIFPLSTFKVIAAIHWEALKLWVRGARYRPPPRADGNPHKGVSTR